MWQGQPQQPYYPPPPDQQQQFYGQSPYPPQQPGYPYPPQGPPNFSQPYNPAYPHQMPNNPPYSDAEGNIDGYSFDDESIRKGFIRKVYSILTVQLLISLTFIAVFVFHEPTKLWVQKHHELMWIAMGVLFVTMIALACCENVRRSFPMNFIFLGLFTLAQSFMLGVISSVKAQDVVFMAVGLTAVVCFGLTIFAFQTKWDFTVCGGVLFVAAIILMVFGIVAMFFPGKTLHLVYASCGALLFCIYLVYDTQMMMGGKHKYSISPEEYIFAALNLYIDIVNIFMYTLTILGIVNDD